MVLRAPALESLGGQTLLIFEPGSVTLQKLVNTRYFSHWV